MMYKLMRKMTAAILSVLCLFGAVVLAEPPAPFPCEWIGDIDKARFNEPSGICYHAQRGTLFVAGDEGDVCEITTDGTMIRQKRVRRADFEGITYDPSSGLLYVVIEGEEAILELDPDSLNVLREFKIPRSFQGATLMKEGGQGIEAIVFVPDPKLPQGGTFFVANQSIKLDDPEDISGIFEVEVPLKSSGEVKILRYFEPGIPDLSGLYYDAADDRLYVISDVTNQIGAYTRTGERLDLWMLPGNDQEGIAFDAQGYLYIAQDSGGIIKLKWQKEVIPSSSLPHVAPVEAGGSSVSLCLGHGAYTDTDVTRLGRCQEGHSRCIGN